MMMVSDVKSRKEAESAANGAHWAARGGIFATGTPFLVSFLGNFSTTVQVNKLRNHTRASRSAQLDDHLLMQTPKHPNWKNTAFPVRVE